MNSPQMSERSFKDFTKSYSIRDGLLFKKALKSKHFLRKPLAIAIDKELLEETISQIRYIQVYEREESLYYTVSVSSFIKHCFRFDRGFREQVALPIKFWVTSKNYGIPVEANKPPSLFDFNVV